MRGLGEGVVARMAAEGFEIVLEETECFPRPTVAATDLRRRESVKLPMVGICHRDRLPGKSITPSLSEVAPHFRERAGLRLIFTHIFPSVILK